MTSPIPDFTNLSITPNPTYDYIFPFQLMSISYATQALFLGNILAEEEPARSLAGNLKPPFLSVSLCLDNYLAYSWGDVLKGIEEMSHNVTAALLTLSLGTMNATCSFYQQDLVYQYTPSALWVPYGVSNFFFDLIS